MAAEEQTALDARCAAYTAEQAAQWQAKLDAREDKCVHCGSAKITRAVRGRPMGAYVSWAADKAEELGYAPFSFSGWCVSMMMMLWVDGDAECANCHKNPLK